MLRTFLLFFVLSSFAFSFQSKESAFDSLTKRFSNLKTLKISFYSIEHKCKGTLLAKNGNKYRLNFCSRLIVSDGKTLWNFSVEQTKVVIQNLDEQDNYSLDKIFFNIKTDFVPKDLYRENNSSFGSSNVLKLTHKNESDRMFYIFFTDKFQIKALRIVDNNIQETFKILSIKINKKISDSNFKFTPSKDIEIIDLR